MLRFITSLPIQIYFWLRESFYSTALNTVNSKPAYLVLKEVYCKYRELNSKNQMLFRDTILSNVTQLLLHELNNASDISDSSCNPSRPWVFLYLHTDIFDKRGGVFSQAGWIEAGNKINDISCSREFVRFVHEHNTCNCLESAYNELKKTTRRTNGCIYCKVLKPVKQIKGCSGCKSALYCSRECQVADYPTHKMLCKNLQEQLKREMGTAECVD